MMAACRPRKKHMWAPLYQRSECLPHVSIETAKSIHGPELAYAAGGEFSAGRRVEPTRLSLLTAKVDQKLPSRRAAARYQVARSQ